MLMMTMDGSDYFIKQSMAVLYDLPEQVTCKQKLEMSVGIVYVEETENIKKLRQGQGWVKGEQWGENETTIIEQQLKKKKKLM